MEGDLALAAAFPILSGAFLQHVGTRFPDPFS